MTRWPCANMRRDRIIAHAVGTTGQLIVNCPAIARRAVHRATFTTPVGTIIESELSIIYQDSADQLLLGAGSFLLNVLDCPWNLDGNGTVGVSDLLSLLVSWGPCKGCPADFDGSGNVGVSDLLALLANWGPCP